MPAEADLSYCAGFFDADGCVNIGKGVSSGQTYHMLQLRVTLGTFAPLDLFQQTFGGVWRVNNRGYCEWTLGGPAAADALETMLPFLRVKRDQAKVAIRFQRTCKTGARLTTKRRARIVEQGEKARLQIVSLRGVA